MIGMGNIVMMDLSPDMAIRIVKECAEADGCRVTICKHARERMVERKISRAQMLNCLLKGSLSEPPHKDVRGDWRCTVSHYTCGHYINAALAIKINECGERIVVITMF